MSEPKKKELGGTRKMSTGMKVGVGIFAVIMALSMTLPSLTSIFGNRAAEEETTEQKSSNENEAKTDESKTNEDEKAKEEEKKAEEQKKEEQKVPDNETLKNLAETNAENVEKYSKRLEEDENNLAALLHLGETFMNWGYSAMNSSTTDEEKEYSKGLLNKATEYFDRYLKLNDSVTVKIDRTLVEYYAGDADKAVTDLKKICDENPENSLAWAQLGYLYESQYKNEDATAAYKKAIEVDPDDAYGVKSYANQRLIAMNAKVSSPGDAGDAAVEPSDEGQSELLNKLTEGSGLGTSGTTGSGGNVITL